MATIINKVPDEILSLIFSNESLKATFCEPKNLTAIISTCARWQRIALSTPHLWRSIAIHPLGPDDTLSWLTKERLQYWIRNSGSVLLDVEIGDWRKDQRHEDEDTDEVGERLYAENIVSDWDSPGGVNLGDAIELLLNERTRWSTVVLHRLPSRQWLILDALTLAFTYDAVGTAQQSLPFLALQSLAMAYPSRNSNRLQWYTSPNIRKVTMYALPLGVMEWNKYAELSPTLEDIELHFVKWEGYQIAHKFTASLPFLQRFVYGTAIRNFVDPRREEAELLYGMLKNSPRLESFEFREEDILERGRIRIAQGGALYSAGWLATQSALSQVKTLRISLRQHRSYGVDRYVQDLHNLVSLFVNIEELTFCRDRIDDWVPLWPEDLKSVADVCTNEIHKSCMALGHLRKLTLDNVPVREEKFLKLVESL
jgi:hypothetical protein